MSKRSEPPSILITRILPDIAGDILKKANLKYTQWPEDRPMTRDEFLAAAANHNCILCTLTDKVDKEFLSAHPQIKMLSQFGVGYDNIDITEVTRLGIPVGNTPGVLTDATADIAFGLMLATARKMFHLHQTILNGGWKYFQPTAHLGLELKGKTLGVFGLGRIGLEMAKRCKGAFNMRIIYNKRNKNAEAESLLNAKWVTFDDLLAQSDVLSVHTSLNELTNGVFNRNAFNKMKRNAIFINTARGGIHVEADLIDALQTGKIWGAGLDVTNPEPISTESPLLSMESVAVLPHVGSATVEARNEMARLAALNIVGYFKDGVVPHLVNPTAADKNRDQ